MRSILILFLVGLFRTPSVLAQCAPSWTDPFETPLGKPNFGTGVSVDYDGDGPSPLLSIFHGRFILPDGTEHQGIAGWDGNDWTPLGAPFTLGANQFISEAVAFDEDGPGPNPPAIWYGGNFLSLAGVTTQAAGRFANGIWTGTQQDIPPVRLIARFAILDEDDDGPGLPRLCIHGSFAEIGDRIAMLDGDHWELLGGELGGGGITSLLVADPDGDGPVGLRLIVCGGFSSISGIAVNRVGQWNGSNWEPVFGGTDGEITSATVHDPDGDGPRHDELCVVGTFVHAGGVETRGAARLHDGAWEPIASDLAAMADHSQFEFIAAANDDGAGPNNELLFIRQRVVSATGGISDRTYRGSAGNWEDISDRGDGGQAIYPPVAMNINGRTADLVSGSARYWNGESWIQCINPSTVIIHTMRAIDLDGAGPNGTTLVVGGEQLNLPGHRIGSCVAQWDGVQWLTVGPPGLSGQVRAMEVHDPDGDGPGAPRLLLGGRITLNGIIYGVVQLTPDGWEPFGNSTLGTSASERVNVMAIYDADGPGEAAPAVIISGVLQNLISNPTMNGVAKWNGNSWEPMGAFTRYHPFVDMQVHDPDGVGPAHSRLYAVLPSTAPNIQFPHPNGGVIYWDGQQWHPIVDAETGDVTRIMNNQSVCFFDQGDGYGPSLCAGGWVDTPSPMTGFPTHVSPVRYRSGSWQDMGTNQIYQSIRALLVHDDGISPGLRPTIYYAGEKTGINTPLKNAGKWNGTAWEPMGTGLNGKVNCFESVDFDGSGSSPPHLVYTGGFTKAGVLPVTNLASWTVPAPRMIVQPWSRIAIDGADVSIKISVRGAGPMMFQWLRGGQLVADGGAITGTTTRELRISAAAPEHDGAYACVATNSCGSTTSLSAFLHVCAAVPIADINHDGAIDGQDISPFVDAWRLGLDGVCTADLNGNTTLDTEDLSWFIGWLLAAE